MTHAETPSGTPTLELDAAEYAHFLDEEVRARTELSSAAEFTERYLAGELDESDPDVPFLVGLLWIGQNGHRVTA